MDLPESAVDCARRLLGSLIVRTIGNKQLIGRIVETEAYDQSDKASHSYRGQTKRNAVMFGPAGVSYVYFTYGMHYCFNVVCGPSGHGSAVLIRALEPIDGQREMRANRGRDDLTNGPAKLCQALSIDQKLNSHDLSKPPLLLKLEPELKPSQIQTATRIGIRDNAHLPRRFFIRDNPFVSKSG